MAFASLTRRPCTGAVEFEFKPDERSLFDTAGFKLARIIPTETLVERDRRDVRVVLNQVR